MDRKEIIKKIDSCKIVVILRGFTTQELIGTVGALEKGGIYCCEITYDSLGKTPDDAIAEQIRVLTEKYPEMCIGAGTVLTEKQVELTAKAGGKFIISPDTNPDVIKKTIACEMVSIPGAFTPSEATLADRSGADFVKLFPNAEVNPSYIKTVSLPLSHIKFLAVGGVNLENIPLYIKNGACGFGIATAIANKKLIAEEKFDEIADIARQYADAVKNA